MTIIFFFFCFPSLVVYSYFDKKSVFQHFGSYCVCLSPTHTLSHSLAHTHTHSRTLSPTHTLSRPHTLTHTLLPTHTHSHTLSSTHTHSLTHSHTLSHSLTHTHTHSPPPHTHTLIVAHSCRISVRFRSNIVLRVCRILLLPQYPVAESTDVKPNCCYINLLTKNVLCFIQLEYLQGFDLCYIKINNRSL